jgi:hypothetical protein
LWPDDLELLHRLWLELSQGRLGPKLHHRDVVRVALHRLETDIHSPHGEEVVDELGQEMAEPAVEPPVDLKS